MHRHQPHQRPEEDGTSRQRGKEKERFDYLSMIVRAYFFSLCHFFYLCILCVWALSLSFTLFLSPSPSLTLSLSLFLLLMMSLSHPLSPTLYVCLSVYLSPLSLSVCLSISLSLSLSACHSLSVCLSICLSFSVYLPICLSFSVSLSICLSFSVSVTFITSHLSQTIVRTSGNTGTEQSHREHVHLKIF